MLSCNTASAKALRTIQQVDLPKQSGLRKVLGVIRPTTEVIVRHTVTRHIGVLATPGTVKSMSYPLEIQKFYPDIAVYQQACPMWVPLVENAEPDSPGTAYFVEREINGLLQQSPDIDTVVLACTHYPLLYPQIRRFLPDRIRLLSQGELVADSLADYLLRHPEVEKLCAKGGRIRFFTTDNAAAFEEKAETFYGQPVKATEVNTSLP